MEKDKTLLAVILSLLVIITFQYFVGQRYAKVSRPAMAGAQVQRIAIPEENAALSKDVASPAEQEYTVDTKRFRLIFSSLGGALKSVYLKDFLGMNEGEPYQLIKIDDPSFYIGTCNISTTGVGEGGQYAMTRDGNKIIFTTISEGFEIKKIYGLQDDADCVTFSLELTNKSGNERTTSINLSSGAGLNVANPLAQRYNYATSKIDGIAYLTKKDFFREGYVSWMSINNDYFMSIVKPIAMARKSHVRHIKGQGLVASIETESFTILNGMKITQDFIFYFGPFDASRVKALKMDLDDSVNYGKLNWIVKVLLETLRFFQRVVRNWGLAIIIVTVLINVVVFPLTKSSYRSMRVSQELQPEIEKLRAVHKDNPNKLNKEIMGLYRQYKINPVSGCLPMVMQFPIFFALYHALMRSVELKGSNFLWIKDLSRPDALGLPFALPIIGRSINILPILTGIIMLVQQKIMSAKKSDKISEQIRQQQAMMTVMMPAMMLVFFYTMPSGFVLYFLVNSVIMAIVQQRIKMSMN